MSPSSAPSASSSTITTPPSAPSSPPTATTGSSPSSTIPITPDANLHITLQLRLPSSVPDFPRRSAIEYEPTSRAKAQHAFTAEKDTELSIHRGQLLDVLHKEEGKYEGWWWCRDPQTQKKGWVPGNRVEVILREVVR